MIRFSLFGIPVEVQPFFWITLVILGGAIGADTAADVFRILLFVLAGFISRSYGANVQVTLQAFGGFAAYSGVRMSRARSFLITAAGPGVQIILGLIVFAALPFLGNLNENGAYFLSILMFISFFWAILNLLPVLPLDGGQMLNAVLGPARLKITLWVTIIVSIGVGVAMLFKTSSIIFPIFLGMFAWQAFQALKENRLN